MKRAGPKKQVTHDDVELAVKAFLAKGGKIQTLPKQNFTTSNYIGGEKYDAYESLSDISV